jgi:murein DD-endopeptidase MepM/ murein hydrolase activator NlpD
MIFNKKNSNRFFTVMIIPEKTAVVRKFLIPSWLASSLRFGGAILAVLIIVMIANYGYVMNEVSENNELRMENRRLRQQVQTFRNKMDTLNSNVERVKTLSTKLRVITGSEDRGGAQALMKNIPDSSQNIAQNKSGLPSEIALISEELEPRDPEREVLKKQYLELDAQITTLTAQALTLEQTLQDQYESLVDQKAFLSAIPTRKPAVGYFTSGFGIRRAPIGGKIKMHEGLDIANHPGTPIKAAADGVIAFADGKAGYGQTVIIDHGYGVETLYAHTAKILVKKGAKVKRGEAIALLGNSGRSTGPHLHYEVKVNGLPVDPLTYILEN